jgi:putative spermidine/putrescine transport system substrate-binding protein
VLTVVAAAAASSGSTDDVTPGLAFFAELNRAGNLLPLASNNSLVGTGETPIRITWDYNALAGLEAFAGKRHAAMVIPASGRVANLFVQAINARAPHPNAARLWMEYLFSAEAQTLRARRYCHPVGPVDLTAGGGALADAVAELPDVTGSVFPSPEQLARAREAIAAQWKSVVGVDIAWPE